MRGKREPRTTREKKRGTDDQQEGGTTGGKGAVNNEQYGYNEGKELASSPNNSLRG